ncbi:MAG: (2Fe-2S)-binding protein [Gemmatimonadales bacterium]|nr:(2Fe-2S)-binding protein [Gemmatimonadales bacterium]
MAKLTIDGKEIEVPDGTRLFDACTEARGRPLPHFCYHPDLPVAGVCRLCQVEIEGMPKLAIACNTIVRDGMVVHTMNERVNKANQQVLELHLINHPVDCPICDQAGECGLQDQYMEFGLYDSKVEQSDKGHKAKVKVIGPQVILDQERCVLCSRCVRFCREVTKTGELGIYDRGDRAHVDVAPGVELDNLYSLNTVDLCPVGALTSRDFRFQKRVWMLKSTEGICPGCATGCNIRIDHHGGRIFRLKPRYNPEVNGRWMCDRGRMTYKVVHDEKRLDSPLKKSGGQLAPLQWSELEGELSGMLKPGGVSLVIGSSHLALEELFLLKQLGLQVAGEDQIIGGLAESDQKDGDDLLLSSDRTPNRAGLALVGLEEMKADLLADRIKEARGTILIHGGNPAADPLLAEVLANCQHVVYIGTHVNETAQLAAYALPGASWAEKAGTFVNQDGRLQQFQSAVVCPGSAREDWRVLAEMLVLAGGEESPGNLDTLRKRVSSELFNGQEFDLNTLSALGVVPSGLAEPADPVAGGEG